MSDAPEAVVLLPGLWLPWWTLFLLRRRLGRNGYAAYIFAYRSVRDDLFSSSARLGHFVQGLDADTVHFVGHSLGGVVVRALFHYSPPSRPGRIVSLGSPLSGTRAGEHLARSPLGRTLIGRAVMDVVAGEPRTWVPPRRDFGAIAGDRPVGLAMWMGDLDRPHDGVVSLAEAQPSWATDRRVLHHSHTGMLAAPDTARQLCEFLKTGRFADEAREQA
jgi:pimeloyl-ACP methyl ester carboxylesterase